MNFKIKLIKTNITPAVVSIEFLHGNKLLHGEKFFLSGSADVRSIDYNLDLGSKYVLRISRNESELYQTDKLVHDSHVIVDSITIDNFWTIGKANHWSKTVYDKKYIDHLRDKPVTWELDKELYNNVLFFNGSLQYTITTPIRKMFFK
jgi:hypothetical protein